MAKTCFWYLGYVCTEISLAEIVCFFSNSGWRSIWEEYTIRCFHTLCHQQLEKSNKGEMLVVSLPECMKLHISVLWSDTHISTGKIMGVRRSIFNSHTLCFVISFFVYMQEHCIIYANLGWFYFNTYYFLSKVYDFCYYFRWHFSMWNEVVTSVLLCW